MAQEAVRRAAAAMVKVVAATVKAAGAAAVDKLACNRWR
jgi:hypothetical protein